MLISEVKNHLENCIVPFWKNFRDDTYGGYYGYVDFNLELEEKAIKGCILNSRIMWFFSNAYTTLKDESLLEEANHAFKFMKSHCIDKTYEGVFWMLDYKGNPVEEMKHTYNQAFAIYALSSYYWASHNQEALEMALGLFHLIEKKCKDEYGYLEAFDRKWQPIDNHKLSDNKHMEAEGKVAEKTMNTILHVLEAYTELYRVSKEAEVGACLRKILEMVDEKVYNREAKQLEVFFDTKLNSIANMHSYGHDIEAAWLIDCAAEVLEDKELIEKTKEYTVEIAYKVKEVAFTKQGMKNERFNDEIDTTRIWWVQAEAVVGFLNAYEKTSDPVFKEAANDMWQYIKNYMLDKRTNSEWFWQVDENGKPNRDYPIVEPWKCPYHNGRMCLEVIRRKIDV